MRTTFDSEHPRPARTKPPSRCQLGGRSGLVRVVKGLTPGAVAVLVGLMAGGCAAHWAGSAPAASPPPGGNFYRAAAKLPWQVRRVAVLPVTVESTDWQAEEGADELEPVLYAELGKSRAFELMRVSPEQLRNWTGRPSWSAQDKLPPDFFGRLEDALGCDGVLFTHLRPYRAYRPIVIGWNFKLVETRTKSILWAADEVFDASAAAVAKAAEDYGREHIEAVRAMKDSGSILNSPRRFSQYTLSVVFNTLPER